MSLLPYKNRFEPLAGDDYDHLEEDVSPSESNKTDSSQPVPVARRRPGGEKRKKSPKSRSVDTSSEEEFDKALESIKDLDNGQEGWGDHDIPDSSLEELSQEANRPTIAKNKGTLTNDQVLQAAFRSTANSISATIINLQTPRGSTGRGGGITKAAGQNDALDTMPHSALPPKTKVQPILPTKTATETSEPKTMFSFQAKLTLGLQTSREVNVAILFSRFLANAIKTVPDFSLYPYDDDKGQQVTATTQLPEDNSEFYATYYKNHRILQHGNLTGMIFFRCSLSWRELKKPTSSFFQWLYRSKVFLNQTRIKATTLVACGFLHGAHLGYLRRNEAEVELEKGINENHEEKIPFQLSARTVTVPISDGKPKRFPFHAVVIETSVEHATRLRERFYSLGDPDRAAKIYPYMGKYFFVPLSKFKEWPVDKIWKLAKTNADIIRNLRPIFVENLQDLRNLISQQASLREGFMTLTHMEYDTAGKLTSQELILHSIHNTSNPTTKVAVVPHHLYNAAMH
jgi:hypothetical protein